MTRLSCIFWISLMVSAAGLRGQSGVPLPDLGSPLGNSTWAIADFDGDGQPDLLTSRVDAACAGAFCHTIHLQLTSRRGASSSFVIPGQPSLLNVVARDIDGDRDLDLVVTSGFSHQRVGVWVNDGAGGFSAADPSSYPAGIWEREDLQFMRRVQRLPDRLFLPPPQGASAAMLALPRRVGSPTVSSPLGAGQPVRLLQQTLHPSASRAPPTLL